MRGSHCRLYDENLVRTIMINTSLSIMEYVKTHADVNAKEVCEYLKFNSDDIIDETIKNLNKENTPPQVAERDSFKQIDEEDDLDDEDSEQTW